LIYSDILGADVDKRQVSADLGLLMVTAIWGATFVMVKDAVASFPVFAFLSLRFWLALLALLPFAAVRWLRARSTSDGALGTGGTPAVSRRTLSAGLLIGLALFSGYAFQTFGLRFTTPAKAGFITGLSVVMVPMLSALLIRRPPSRSASLGVLLATAGLALLSLQGNLAIALGDLLVLACAISFALHIVAVGAYSPHMDSLTLVVLQIATVALLSTAAAVATEWPLPPLERNVLIAAGFTGLAATALAFGVQTVAQRFTTPTHTALIFAMEPVFAGLFSFWFTGEILGPRALLGGGLILAGMLVAEMTPAISNARRKLSDSPARSPKAGVEYQPRA